MAARAEALTRAVELLAAGEWQPAHKIVQGDTSTLAAWLHGIVHTLEGDLYTDKLVDAINTFDHQAVIRQAKEYT